MNDNRLSRIVDGDGSDLPARMNYRDGEREAVHAEKRRIYMRTAHCDKTWDGRADNDNIAWPLATALIREGNTELLKAAVAYRKIHNDAHSGAVLGGNGVVMREGFSLDRHTHVRPNGTIAYKHVRQRSAAEVDIPAVQYVPPFEDEEGQRQHNVVKVPKPWNGDYAVNTKLDAQSKLVELRDRLGVLVEPLEMAAIDGETYQVVGNASGVADRSGSIAAGRAIVHMALLAVRDALGKVERKDLAA